MIHRSRFRRRAPKGRKLNPRQKREVKKLIADEAEVKSYIDNSGVQSVTVTPGFTDVTALITQGNTDATRVGSEIKLHGLKLCWSANTLSMALADNYNRVRVIVFQWHADSVPNQAGVQTALFDITSGIPYTYAFFDHQNKPKYTILYDKVVNLIPIWAFTSGGALVGNEAKDAVVTFKPITLNIRKARKKIFYTEGANSSGMNHIYVGIVSDSANVPHPNLQYGLEVLYTDC